MLGYALVYIGEEADRRTHLGHDTQTHVHSVTTQPGPLGGRAVSRYAVGMRLMGEYRGQCESCMNSFTINIDCISYGMMLPPQFINVMCVSTHGEAPIRVQCNFVESRN